MQRGKAYYKRTRRGKVLRIVEDHYLRDDIGCGTLAGKQLTQPALLNLIRESALHTLLVLDANVLLSQITLLECRSVALSAAVVTQTALEECRHRNLSSFRRLQQLLRDDSRGFIFFANEHHCDAALPLFDTAPPVAPARGSAAAAVAAETPNDRNDRAIRRVAAWYAAQLGEEAAGEVVLLTDDRECRRRAAAAGIKAQSVKEFVASVEPQCPGLAELVADSGENGRDEDGDGGGKRRVRIYEDHKPMSEVMKGVREGRYFQGTMRVAKGVFDGYVVVQGLESLERVAVYIWGRENTNRALDGDVVAIEMLPRDQWEQRGGGGSGGVKGGGGKADAAAVASGAAGEAAAERNEAPREDGEGEGAAGADIIPEPTAPPEVEDVENVDKLPELRPTGKVVGIIRRNWRQYCGSILPSGDRMVADGRMTSALFAAVDKKVPRVRLQTRQRAALEGKRILVAPDSWPAWCKYPLGHYVKTLGDAGDKAIESEVILLEHDIPHEAFSGEVLRCLPPSDWKMTPENTAGRTDLRHLLVMSIDPPGCKDIDDALHARQLENGNMEVGVHIADVTGFVAADSALDREAAHRATSTYLVDRRLDMLPGLLTETLCSLRANVDRFAFSVVFELSPGCNILDVKFTKSIIRSSAALTYDEAQLMLDNPRRTDAAAEAVRQLNRVAKTFRARRLEAGALTLASPEVKFVLDSETQNPTDVQAYALKEANALVEEFMLLANITVSKKILKHHPTLSMLRRHPSPSRQQFDALVSSAAAAGFEINVDTSKHLADSLDAAEREGDPYFNKLLRILSTRCMSPAAYFCSGDHPQPDWHHYGLAAPVYTHFTSPIRRYADVVVHRLLAAAIGVAALPPPLADRRRLHELAEHMNRRHRAAQFAGRASVALHTAMFFKGQPTEAEAYLLSVFDDRVTVLVPRYGIEGSVVFREASDAGLLKHDAEAHVLQYAPPPPTAAASGGSGDGGGEGGARGGGEKPATLRVFDRVKVRVRVEDGTADGAGGSRSVVMDLIEPLVGRDAWLERQQALEAGEGALPDATRPAKGKSPKAVAAVAAGSGKAAKARKRDGDSDSRKAARKKTKR